MKRDGRTLDLFEPIAVFPVRRPSDTHAGLFSSDVWLRHLMSRALQECAKSREAVAAEMGRIAGDNKMSVWMLNNYTAESNEAHRISAMRLFAFIRATGATWILDAIAERFGCIVMEGEEALLAERGLLRQRIEELQARERELSKAKPIRVTRRRP